MCAAHPRVEIARRERRGSSRERGYTPEWDRRSAAYRKEHPLCECPIHRGRDDAPLSEVVDHIVPHRGDPVLFWDPSNWQALAKACHDRKTATEDGGFGNRRRATNHTR